MVKSFVDVRSCSDFGVVHLVEPARWSAPGMTPAARYLYCTDLPH